MLYADIHRLYGDGFSKSAIAKKLKISRNRVIDYLKMDPDEFGAFLSSLHKRRKKLDPYQDRMVMWLNEHPDLTAAQIYDWLQEKAGMDGEDASENTVRNYVNDLRDRYSIPKVNQERVYGSTEELPMGLQGQVDFGQTVVNDQDGKRHRIYFIAFILSCSRYKYIECLDRPFRTEDVVHAHERAFQYFEGMPKEMVYDQDALLAVSENAGDLIMTEAFMKYQKARGFEIYLCRKGDPESKGKVEQVVKYVKMNFCPHRIFNGIDKWNESAWKWLERTGNYKVHHNTKKRPSEVHALEKQHLIPVKDSHYLFDNVCTTSITRRLHKDNVIRFKGNRFSVPKGTYQSGSANIVHVFTEGNQLEIRLKPNGQVIGRHEIPSGRGHMVIDPDHRNSSRSKRDALIREIEDFFSDTEPVTWFINELEVKYPRYIMDQLNVMKRVMVDHPTVAEDALRKVYDLKLTSANDYRNVAMSIAIEEDRHHKENGSLTKSNDKYSDLQAPERSPDAYLNVLSGGA